MQVELGNPSAKEGRRDPTTDEVAFSPLEGERVTYVTMPPSYSLLESVTAITHPSGIWAHHADAPPSWVWSDNEALQALLAESFGCPVGRPEDLEDTHHTRSGPPGTGPGTASDTAPVDVTSEEVPQR